MTQIIIFLFLWYHEIILLYKYMDKKLDTMYNKIYKLK